MSIISDTNNALQKIKTESRDSEERKIELLEVIARNLGWLAHELQQKGVRDQQSRGPFGVGKTTGL